MEDFKGYEYFFLRHCICDAQDTSPMSLANYTVYVGYSTTETAEVLVFQFILVYSSMSCFSLPSITEIRQGLLDP